MAVLAVVGGLGLTPVSTTPAQAMATPPGCVLPLPGPNSFSVTCPDGVTYYYAYLYTAYYRNTTCYNYWVGEGPIEQPPLTTLCRFGTGT
jgi:hypothetical protein